MGVFFKIKNKNRLTKMPCKNLAIAFVDGQLKFCIVRLDKKTGEILNAHILHSCKSIDKENVIKVSDMFTIYEVYDRESGQDITGIRRNWECKEWKNIYSQKTIDALHRLSPYAKIIDWQNEENGVSTIIVDDEKKVSFKKLLRLEEKLNKIERSLKHIENEKI